MKTNKSEYQKEDMSKAIDKLRNGGNVSFSDECGQWVACDACNEKAVDLILATFGENPHILIDQPAKLQSYLHEIPEMAWDLMDLSEKPLMLYLENSKNLAPILTQARENGFRMATDKFAIDLCIRFRRPLFVCSYRETDIEIYHSDYKCSKHLKMSKIRIDTKGIFSIIEQ